jgi:hypothetical protein
MRKYVARASCKDGHFEVISSVSKCALTHSSTKAQFERPIFLGTYLRNRGVAAKNRLLGEGKGGAFVRVEIAPRFWLTLGHISAFLLMYLRIYACINRKACRQRTLEPEDQF